MKCPACSRELIEIRAAGLAVDVCQEGCGGVWFDNHELQQVDEAHEPDLESLLDIRFDLEVEVDYRARRQCPRCPGIVLIRQGYAGARNVQIDTCGNCGGVWLDGGELSQIRHRAIGADRIQATSELRQLLPRNLARARSA